MSTDTSILDHPRISRNYFFARDDRPDETFPVPSGDATLACAHRNVDPSASTVVHFHGNGETVADYVPWMADQLEEFGLNSLFVEYRGYGASTGSPALVRQLGDIPAIFDALDTPAQNLIVFGRSIGSLYAIEFADRYPDIAGLIVESGIADVLERILIRVSPRALDTTYEALRREADRHFDHQAKLGDYEKPLLVMHTRDDHLVDVSHARRLHDWAASFQKRLVVFDDGSHNTIRTANPEEYRRNLRLFCEMHG